MAKQYIRKLGMLEESFPYVIIQLLQHICKGWVAVWVQKTAGDIINDIRCRAIL